MDIHIQSHRQREITLDCRADTTEVLNLFPLIICNHFGIKGSLFALGVILLIIIFLGTSVHIIALINLGYFNYFKFNSKDTF